MGNLPPLPLFEHFFKEAQYSLVSRPFDSRWHYIGAIKGFQSGFNPFLSSIFYNEISELSFWLKGSELPTRQSQRKRLLNEILFLLHDYLHMWSMRLIDQFCRLNFGDGILGRSNRDLELFMILTEAVATVGLDYWVLSQADTGSPFGLDRGVQFLTINLHSEQVEAIRKINPGFSIHRESLYTEIAHFYTSGIMLGFGIDDVKKCKELESYIVHELSYGELQRAYARMFVQYAFEGISRDETDTSPIELCSAWHHDLIGYIGRHLWNFVHNGTSPDLQPLINVFPPLRMEQRSRPNPRLVVAEKFLDLSSEELLDLSPSGIHLFLSNIDIGSFSTSDQDLILNEVKSKEYAPDLSGFFKKLESYGSVRRLAQNHQKLPDFIFSIP